MQISSRFTIAIHIFTCTSICQNDHKITSDFLAGSINVNPVIIRKILQQLKGAGLISVARGSGGATVTKPLNEISLLDVFRAVKSVDDNQLFHFHEKPNMRCSIGKNIHNVLDDKLNSIQQALENQLGATSIQDIVDDMSTYISTN